MTARADREGQGTYTDGYDAGLRDASHGHPRKYGPPRSTRASFYRIGYADGYHDGKGRKTMGSV